MQEGYKNLFCLALALFPDSQSSISLQRCTSNFLTNQFNKSINTCNAFMCDLTQGCLHFYSQSFLHQGFLSLVVAFSYTDNILVEWSGLWSQIHQGWSLGSPHMSLSETPLTGDTVKLSSLGGYSVCNLHVEGFAFLFSLLTVNIINDSDVCLVMDTLTQLLTLWLGNDRILQARDPQDLCCCSRPSSYVFSALKCFYCSATWLLKPEGNLIGFLMCLPEFLTGGSRLYIP